MGNPYLYETRTADNSQVKDAGLFYFTDSANQPTNSISVTDKGAKGNGTTDDTAAIAAAITAIRAGVGTAGAANTLFFPPGHYRITSTLNLSALCEIRIIGSSGKQTTNGSDTTPPCYIDYQAGGAGPALNLADAQGVIIDGVSVYATTSAFSGKLVTFDATTPNSLNSGDNRIQNMALRVTSGTGTPTLLSLDGTACFSADNVTLSDCPGGSQVKGITSSFANALSFKACLFSGNRTNTYLNPAFQTTFVDCTFEHNSGATAPITATATWNGYSAVTSFHGCGFWDVTSGSGTWIKSSVASSSWGCFGCYFSIPPTGTAFDLGTGLTGLSVEACHFEANGGGTPNVFKSTNSITNGSMLGCFVKTPAVDNHASVFV